ncbi:hypothetical protein [Nocardioides alcanivorans]|uniref:hypothetical protein n=1 Tax=Nocardioides alcanivorans TaxID=2897352 RepID=UPI001F27DC08|nr:hypothetical protein [Nocardioides alcanivorans]
MALQDEDRFPPSNGRAVGWFGVVAVTVGIVVVIANGYQSQDLVAVPVLLLFGYLVWVAVLQTQASVRDGHLELNNSFHTTRVPLASITEAEVRMALIVRLAEGDRLTFAAISRSRREIAKNAPKDPLTNYPDLVEARLTHRATEARELGQQPGPVERVPSQLRIGILAALVALVAVGALIA